jgi:hypothetical protein
MTENDGSGVAIAAADRTDGERRRHKRVAVNLPGRYMLEDGTEHTCTCVDISAGGLRLRAAQTGVWGSRVIAYVEGIGRLEGHIIRRAPGWFALQTHSSARRGERVQERIEALLNAHEGAGCDPRETADRVASLHTLDGQRHEAVLTDVSEAGAALLTEAALKVDERVRLDSRRARVARVFPGGAALKFDNWVDDAWPPREAAAPTQPPSARRA